MIRIIAVGKCKEKAMLALINEYQKRLKPFVKTELIEVADEHAPQSLSLAQMEQVKQKEGERILSKLKDSDYVILLDFAFVIGGSLGIAPALIQRSDFRWKLSDLTFPHQLVRVLLYEQLYRSFTILHHQPYHK